MFLNTAAEGGSNHASKAEAAAAGRLAQRGIVPYDRPLPVSYSDKSGVVLEGRADFADLDLGIWFEWKPCSLNGRTSKAKADKALCRHEQQVRKGFIVAGSRGDDHGRLKCQFNHSAYCIAAKQKAMHAAGHILVLVLGTEPDEDTRRRLERLEVLWLVEGTREFRHFNSMRLVASVPGISATARVCGWEIPLS